jgi:hypothetical protein
VPTLKPGDLVVLGNLSAHKVPRIQDPSSHIPTMQSYCPPDVSQEHFRATLYMTSLKGMSWHGRPPIKTKRQRISVLNTFYSSDKMVRGP